MDYRQYIAGKINVEGVSSEEIASLLGETTAETKVALLKLKKTLQESGEGK